MTVYDRPPVDLIVLPVPNNRFAPHLEAGETAVLDIDDREPVSGEIYVVTIADPREPCGHVLRFVQLRPSTWGKRDNPGWMMHFDLIRHWPEGLTVDQIADLLASGAMSLCDGPMTHKGMRQKIVGRVIGVIL